MSRSRQGSVMMAVMAIHVSLMTRSKVSQPGKDLFSAPKEQRKRNG